MVLAAAAARGGARSGGNGEPDPMVTSMVWPPGGGDTREPDPLAAHAGRPLPAAAAREGAGSTGGARGEASPDSGSVRELDLVVARMGSLPRRRQHTGELDPPTAQAGRPLPAAAMARGSRIHRQWGPRKAGGLDGGLCNGLADELSLCLFFNRFSQAGARTVWEKSDSVVLAKVNVMPASSRKN